VKGHTPERGMPTPSEEESRWLANALATWVKPGDICECDACGSYCLEKHTSIERGSMMKEARICPECDLPENWSSAFSRERKRTYYIYFDHTRPDTRIVQWSHPNPKSPLFIAGDKGDTKTQSKGIRKKQLSRCNNR
jgi:hypothetical protein